MTGDAHKEAVLEAAAQRLKAAMAEMLDAKPLPTPNPGGDWSASGGTLYFTDLAEAVVRAFLTDMQEKGWKLVPRETTGEMRVRMKAHFYESDKWQAAYDAAPDWREDNAD